MIILPGSTFQWRHEALLEWLPFAQHYNFLGFAVSPYTHMGGWPNQTLDPKRH